MKVLSIAEAQTRLAAVCQEALAGEVIRLQLENGARLELLPVPAVPSLARLSHEELSECYSDAEWASFENRCGNASA